MLKHIRWNDVELEKLNPLLDRQMITGENLMLARVLLKKGCVVPEHSHLNEQLTYIVEGALKFWIDGKEIIVRTGEVLCIPPHMPHKAEAIEDTVDLDVFYPPRQDWLNKSDVYLRNAEPASRVNPANWVRSVSARLKCEICGEGWLEKRTSLPSGGFTAFTQFKLKTATRTRDRRGRCKGSLPSTTTR